MGAVVEGVVAVVPVGVTVHGSEGLDDDGVDGVDGCWVSVVAGVDAVVEQADSAMGQASTAATAG